MSVGAQAFDLRQILVSMAKINWEVKEVMSQHNTYIDRILREVQIFTLRLEEVAHKVPVSVEVSTSLWESIAHIITHTLVQGFSEAKKCSNGGRALMQLDFIQFLSKFEKMAGLRPVPHREYVENYIKAFYLPESELEKWIKEHGEYSAKHLFGLVSCACQSNKKTKQRLLQVIDEGDRGDR
ncbi:Coiled-coil domain-containing protein 132-like Protein [Tribolium castaneum]|uniref:Coiled-coil domain-containing protein 132-like Protein n=2 Tax=Tribolium castaneum TaxID=7070 RepID=A0A139WGF5_TRICA|nr:Coiled-coil domain-containing protein 132-like Protein [Tribolium castaneum]